MRKEIQSYGNSSVIVLTKADMKVYGFHQGDIVEITITSIIPYNKLDCLPLPQPCHKLKGNIHTKLQEKQQ
jgi:hypothetical protein